jgi:hypothetical protein
LIYVCPPAVAGFWYHWLKEIIKMNIEQAEAELGKVYGDMFEILFRLLASIDEDEALHVVKQINNLLSKGSGIPIEQLRASITSKRLFYKDRILQ